MKTLKRCFVYFAFVLLAVRVSVFLLEADAFETIRMWGLGHIAGEKNDVFKSYIGNYEYTAVPLTNENVITQVFEITESMLESDTLCVAILFGAYGRENIGEFEGRIIQGEYRQEASFDMQNVGEWQYFEMDYSTTGLEPGPVLLELYADEADEGNCIAPFICTWNQENVNKNDINDYREIDSQEMFRNAKVNGLEQEGPLVMRISTH